MASSTSESTNEPLLSRRRKREVLGLVLISLAVLMGLALLTYSPADDGLARTLSFEAALGGPSAQQANNALGLVGAGLAYTFVPLFLGYTSLLLVGLLFAWGYGIMSRRSLERLPFYSALLAVGTFLLACTFGWFGLTLDTDLHLWSGGVGLGTAAWMQRVFGTVGSIILLAVGLALVALIAIDRDMHHTIRRAERAVQRLGQALAHQLHRLRERWNNVALFSSEAKSETNDDSETASGAIKEEQPAPAPAAPSSTSSRNGSSPNGSDAPSRRVNDLFRGEAPPPETELSPEPTPDQEPAESSSPPPRKDDVQLSVQERIEEEKADIIEHDDPAAQADKSYSFPSIDLLTESDSGTPSVSRDELEENKHLLLDKLDTYNIEISEINAVVGPTVTRYELTPAPGIKVSRITSLENDLAMAMAANGIRILGPIPGKSAVGVEVPNRRRELVRIRDVIGTAKFRDADMELPVAIGKSIEGEVFIRDLTRMPHLLIAGATGSGKSVGLNAFITCLLYACHPATLKFVIIDPKKIELQQYAGLSDQYIAMPKDVDEPITTDVEQAIDLLKSCEREMEARYDLLSKATVRNLKAYNEKVRNGQLDSEEGHRLLPYLVVVVDELADLMMTSGKEVEAPIARLAQKARAVGIHLVLATQRPSVDVITGLIKANFPARMAYEVATRADSRTILDQSGAEGLVGNGDLLFQAGSQIKRLQGPLVTPDEVDTLVSFIGDQPGRGPYELPPIHEQAGDLDDLLAANDRDELFEQAARITVRRQRGSVSLLQRKLSVGYTRAARIVDQLEDAGIVGPHVGSKARDVLIPDEEALEAELYGEE